MSSSAIYASPPGFPLLDDIVVLADAAMKGQVPERIVPRLVDSLRGLLAGDVELPSELLQTGDDGYVRRELYHSSRYDYRVFALTWAPGQGSPIHDHADIWGIEAVLRGQLEVTDYRSLREFEALSELQPTGRHRLTAGSVISLLPPHDLHACRNAGADDVTVSLHIYGRQLDRVRRYVHLRDRLYRQEHIQLTSV